MKKKIINNVYIAGYIYQHDLEKKVTGPQSKTPNTEYITGTLEVATDDACTNVVPVYFGFVTEKTRSGKENGSFKILSGIMNGEYKTVMKDGLEVANKIQIDSRIGLNEFYSDRNGTEELVSVKRNDGGFMHIISAFERDEDKRNTFECDMLITGFRRIEADEEKGEPDKGFIKGAIFNYNNALLPVEFVVYEPKALDFYETTAPNSKEPLFIKVSGNEISRSIVRRVEEESAFGAPIVKEYKSTRKEWVADYAKKPYPFDDEVEGITIAELTDLMAQREIHIAELKKAREDYKARKNKPAATPANGGFNF